ncbi:tripartite motif-containing protein 2-like [Ptychodera flava]|uniref:tripartite motif-containing protein 2-like n=1 Tax=Ptychodera flava TaxID=63121 RepID=UPI003969BEE1
MTLNHIGKNSISYIMDCQSSEALESLMGDYSSGSLHRMVKSTFLSESLLDEIGALYLSLGTSIDYEEYLLCQEELADTEGENLYQLSVEAIEEMNEKIESDVLRKRAAVTMEQVKTREKARDRDILRGMSEEREKGRTSELDELINEWIQIKKELQELNSTHSELVFDRQEFVRKTGAIIDEVDIPLEIKQELMMAFLKYLPLGPDKTGKPGHQLVIEGDFLMEYVENVVHDFDFPTKKKQDVTEQFRKLVREKSGKATAKASLTAKQESLQERIQAIVDDADIPDEQKDVYRQLRQVERGTPLSNTVRVLLSRDGKKSSGEVFNPCGLTINQNGHVLVCDSGHGSVKTVTADTAQILTSVTVHGLPHNFKPKDTIMADNGDYYTVDHGNQCIVVSDAKSEVKQIIAMGKLKDPTGVFVDKDRNVFIADYLADCVIKCNGDGDIISSQQLSEPYSLTMNSKYQLIVSCQGENCIYVLDSNLEILNQFGSDHLVNPWGVTVDNADNIYVADDRKIVKFDRQGEYQETVTVDGNPDYIAVFTDGRIVYSDWIDSTVKVIYK